MFNNYYAPYQRPITYYNPSMPNGQEMANYQQAQQYQQPMAQLPQQANTMPSAPTQPTSDMVWVLNETEAMAYPVALNNSITLWDKNKDTVYIKTNMQGVPSMRILDYTERAMADSGTKTSQPTNNADTNNFVCMDDFKTLQGKFDDLRNELNELKTKAKTKVTKKEADDDE